MKKIMFIGDKIYPLDSGDALYNYGLVKGIEKYFDITSFAFIDPKYIAERDNLDNKNIKLYPSYENCGIRANMMSRLGHGLSINQEMINDIFSLLDTKEYKVVIISHITMIQFARVLKKKYTNIEFIYVSHNVEIVNFREERAQLIKNKKFRLLYKLLTLVKEKNVKRDEKFLLSEFCHSFTISMSDYEIQRHIYKSIVKPCYCKPLIEFPHVKNEESLKKFNKKILLAGSMGWFPNIEGAEWFVNHVFEQLANTGYILYLVGNRPDKKIFDLQRRYPKNIVVTGRVESMDEYFEKCDISIIPLFSGTGAKIKVLESIARGIPTIATSFAVKDYNLKEEVIVADSAEDFYISINQIKENYGRRLSLYRNMQIYYSNYMVLSQEIKSLLDELVK